MRQFRSPEEEHPTTAMLRHMEFGRFAEAGEALARYTGGFLPPPHALWHLGRHLLGAGVPKRAKLALKLFADLYPAHKDLPKVLNDLARVLVALDERREAKAILDQARRLQANKG
jgi:TolA-binding protein